MKIYFAPMEGITSYIFRNAFEKYYGGIDKYFSPFVSPADNCAMNPKESRDVNPENNKGIYLVPQILANKSHHFIAAADILRQMGYQELNLNLGCPSGTVVSKKKGSGFLTEYYELERFLDEIYEYGEKNGIHISVKTRIGRYDPDEWYDLLDLYNRYPIKELIVHPRIRDDYYKGEPRKEYYQYAISNSKNPLVYNGNVYTKENMISYEQTGECLMIGRGLLYNPQLIEEYHISQNESISFDKVRFRKFHDDLYHGYQEIMAPDIHVIYHLKGLWTYWANLFKDQSKTVKKIMKCKKYAEYEACLQELGL